VWLMPQGGEPTDDLYPCNQILLIPCCEYAFVQQHMRNNNPIFL
jgi:hypothetical protein